MLIINLKLTRESNFLKRCSAQKTIFNLFVSLISVTLKIFTLAELGKNIVDIQGIQGRRNTNIDFLYAIGII